MNVLVAAPHPDDESIGCGGTICLHAARGDRVATVFLTSGELGLSEMPPEQAQCVREREAEEAARILGIVSLTFLRRPDHRLGEDIEMAAEALRPILEREQPQLIYLPHERDWHPDHRAALPIVQAALNGSEIPRPSLLSYEVLTPLGEYDRLEDISPVMQRKLQAVRAHRSQVQQLRYDRAARALNEYRGAAAQSGQYAEVFRLAEGCVNNVTSARRADPSWHRLYQLTQEIAGLIPAEAAFILVDEGHLEAAPLVAPRRCLPFLEKDGCYWGKPIDDEAGIREIERMRESDAGFIVFGWTALWWLDHYPVMHRYLRTKYRCVFKDERLVVFDLRKGRLS